MKMDVVAVGFVMARDLNRGGRRVVVILIL